MMMKEIRETEIRLMKMKEMGKNHEADEIWRVEKMWWMMMKEIRETEIRLMKMKEMGKNHEADEIWRVGKM
jgi:hypothetical protein